MAASGSGRRFNRIEANRQVLLEVLGDRQVYVERVLDVSLGGVRITCKAEIQPGTAITITADDMLYFGEIVWRSGDMAGVKFDQVLDLKDLERILEE
jgi:hypothetical protein